MAIPDGEPVYQADGLAEPGAFQLTVNATVVMAQGFFNSLQQVLRR